MQDAADSYLETKSSDELIAELKKVLYVSKVQKEHEILYGQDWQRVYTTNYDEVPILASKDMKNRFMRLPFLMMSSWKKVRKNNVFILMDI